RLTKPGFGRVFALWQLLGVALGSASGERFIAGSKGLAGSAGEHQVWWTVRPVLGIRLVGAPQGWLED
ncbi:hypothetical protein V4890_23180, partial [Ralstonia solanacearum species complex bacterium KE056]